MPIAPKYRLTALLNVTAFIAIYLCGISLARSDGQTILIVTLIAIGLALAMLCLSIPRIAWAGAAAGFVAGATWYWWAVWGDQIHPADQMLSSL